MANFEVIVLGVGDTFSEKYYPPALLLRCNGFLLAIDCPDMYRLVLRSASEKSGETHSLDDIDTILITHVHGDHMNGLECAAFYKHFFQGTKLRLVTSPQVRANIWDERLKGSMGMLYNGAEYRQMGFDDYFDYQPLSWTEASQVGPFRIRARRTRHHVATSALLIEAEGRCLGYSGDTAFDSELISFLEPANLIIHETNLGPAHTSYDHLAALPAQLRARMRLIHYPDWFEPAQSVIAALEQGEVVPV